MEIIRKRKRIFALRIDFEFWISSSRQIQLDPASLKMTSLASLGLAPAAGSAYRSVRAIGVVVVILRFGSAHKVGVKRKRYLGVPPFFVSPLFW